MGKSLHNSGQSKCCKSKSLHNIEGVSAITDAAAGLSQFVSNIQQVTTVVDVTDPVTGIPDPLELDTIIARVELKALTLLVAKNANISEVLDIGGGDLVLENNTISSENSNIQIYPNPDPDPEKVNVFIQSNLIVEGQYTRLNTDQVRMETCVPIFGYVPGVIGDPASDELCDKGWEFNWTEDPGGGFEKRVGFTGWDRDRDRFVFWKRAILENPADPDLRAFERSSIEQNEVEADILLTNKIASENITGQVGLTGLEIISSGGLGTLDIRSGVETHDVDATLTYNVDNTEEHIVGTVALDSGQWFVHTVQDPTRNIIDLRTLYLDLKNDNQITIETFDAASDITILSQNTASVTAENQLSLNSNNGDIVIDAENNITEETDTGYIRLLSNNIPTTTIPGTLPVPGSGDVDIRAAEEIQISANDNILLHAGEDGLGFVEIDPELHVDNIESTGGGLVTIDDDLCIDTGHTLFVDTIREKTSGGGVLMQGGDSGTASGYVHLVAETVGEAAPVPGVASGQIVLAASDDIKIRADNDLTMSNDAGTMTITSTSGPMNVNTGGTGNPITMSTSDSHINITADGAGNSARLQADDGSVLITADSSATPALTDGAILIASGSTTLTNPTSDAITIVSDRRLKLEAETTNVDIDAGTSMTLDANTGITIQDNGTGPININTTNATTGLVNINSATDVTLTAGGTGDITLTAAGDDIYLTSNKTEISNYLEFATGAVGPGANAATIWYDTGDGRLETSNANRPLVIGPTAAVTDNAIARFDTTSGHIIQDSNITISDTGDLNMGTGDINMGGGDLDMGGIGNGNIINAAFDGNNRVAASHLIFGDIGGTDVPIPLDLNGSYGLSLSTGQMIYYKSGEFILTGSPSDNYVLTYDSGTDTVDWEIVPTASTTLQQAYTNGAASTEGQIQLTSADEGIIIIDSVNENVGTIGANPIFQVTDLSSNNYFKVHKNAGNDIRIDIGDDTINNIDVSMRIYDDSSTAVITFDPNGVAGATNTAGTVIAKFDGDVDITGTIDPVAVQFSGSSATDGAGTNPQSPPAGDGLVWVDNTSIYINTIPRYSISAADYFIPIATNEPTTTNKYLVCSTNGLGTWGPAASFGYDLQDAYDASSTPAVINTTSGKSVEIKDSQSLLPGPLTSQTIFRVGDSGTRDYFTVGVNTINPVINMGQSGAAPTGVDFNINQGSDAANLLTNPTNKTTWYTDLGNIIIFEPSTDATASSLTTTDFPGNVISYQVARFNGDIDVVDGMVLQEGALFHSRPAASGPPLANPFNTTAGADWDKAVVWLNDEPGTGAGIPVAPLSLMYSCGKGDSFIRKYNVDDTNVTTPFTVGSDSNNIFINNTAGAIIWNLPSQYIKGKIYIFCAVSGSSGTISPTGTATSLIVVKTGATPATYPVAAGQCVTVIGTTTSWYVMSDV